LVKASQPYAVPLVQKKHWIFSIKESRFICRAYSHNTLLSRPYLLTSWLNVGKAMTFGLLSWFTTNLQIPLLLPLLKLQTCYTNMQMCLLILKGFLQVECMIILSLSLLTLSQLIQDHIDILHIIRMKLKDRSKR